MHKDWLHLSSLDRTIDLNLVSDIQWNKKRDYDKRYCTVVYLGTNIGISDGYTIYNELSIFADKDRKALHAKFPGIPITLSFDETKPQEEKITPIKTGVNNSDNFAF